MTEPSSHDRTMATLGKWSLVIAIIGVAIAFAAYYWPRSPEAQPPGGSGTQTPTQNEKSQYIQAADALCMKWTRVAGTQPASEVTMKEQESALAVLDSMLVEWSALTPPPTDRTTIDSIISKYQEGSDLSRQAFLALSHGDQSSYDSLRQQSITAGQEAMDRSREFGFRVCRHS